MQNLTPEGRRLMDEIASRHAISTEAVLVLLDALVRGNGYQAQFNHPDLGGMGQWSQGGMIMVGDMFNQGLKYRVDALCNELAALVQSQPSLWAPPKGPQFQGRTEAGVSLFVEGRAASGQWWPADLGHPSSSGAQNDMRYAFFPDRRRLAILEGGHVRVYDTGNHSLHGFSQQQSGDQSLSFTSQFGLVKVADLPLVEPGDEQADTNRKPDLSVPAESPSRATAPSPAASAEPPPSVAAATRMGISSAEEILKTIEGLAALRERGILTNEEFATKKMELLGRL
ncbi:SHOCT domain-containing protein [Labrys okinawensis]|uniref:SHOCT domain-containing protein n=1 Tax=Labrys okinawensis TaxID=346911 RepID=UPI0039BC9E01